MKNCLKCGYQRLATDTGPDFSCPKCGAVYAKVEAALAEKIRQNALNNSQKDSPKQATKLDSEENINAVPTKKKMSRRTKLIISFCGLVIFAKIFFPSSHAPVSYAPVTEPKPDAATVCRDKGDNVAKVYFSNLKKMVDTGIDASAMMNEACVVKTQGAECQKLCEDGFKFRTKEFLKN